MRLGIFTKTKQVLERGEAFFVAPASPFALGVLRLTLGAVLLVQWLGSLPAWEEIHGIHGILQGGLQEALHSPWFPSIPQILHWGQALGLSPSLGLWLLTLVYGASLVGLILGAGGRTVRAAAWLLNWLFFHGQATTYGADTFSHIFLTYLVLAPCDEAASLKVRSRGEPSARAGFWLRTLQVHLALAYFASGVEKSLGIQWWNGEVIWRSLMLPTYYQFPMEWMAWVPWLAMTLGWGTLLLEIGYPFAMFGSLLTRRLWVAGILSLHVGIAVFLGLHVFGAVMAVLTLALFGVTERGEWLVTFKVPLRKPLPIAAPGESASIRLDS